LRLILFFSLGALFYAYRDEISIHLLGFVLSIGILGGALYFGQTLDLPLGGLFYAVAPVPLVYCVFYMAASGRMAWLNSRYDISYGVYIYGAVVQQCVEVLLPSISLIQYWLVTGLITICLAVMSWYLLEKPVMRYKNLFS
jgi:peptidoglycan/LPS O-acetylase OafA/YrhL